MTNIIQFTIGLSFIHGVHGLTLIILDKCPKSLSERCVWVSSDDITIKYSEDIISACLKISVSPFKNIVSIKVFEQELGQVQLDIYTALASTFKI